MVEQETITSCLLFQIVCDVGATRSRNLNLNVAVDAIGSDVIGAAIDRLKLTDTETSLYGLIRIVKTTKG